MSPQKGLSFDRLAIGLLAVGLAFRALLMPAQNDTFWHLRAGADIWRTGHLPTVDSYSFTAVGLPWRNHEWLWQLLSCGCYRLGGMPLLTAVSAALALASVALSYRLMAGPRLDRFVILAIGLALGSCGWAVRPQVFTLAAVALLANLLVHERYLWIPPLLLLWANVHAGVLFGLGVLVAAAAAAVWRFLRRCTVQDRRRVIALATVLPLGLVAVLVTPLGFGLGRFVLETNRRGASLAVTEWNATLPDTPLGALFWAAAIAFAILLVKQRRLLSAGGAADTWADWALVAATLALGPLAFRSQRHIGPFITLAIPTASRLLGGELRLWPGRRRSAASAADRPRLNRALLIGASAAAAACVVFAWATTAPSLGWRPLPDGALAALPGCPGPLYNQYDDGGFLIWFAPERPVFVDSRQEPYPLAFLRETLAVEAGRRSYAPLFSRWGIRCAFLERDAPVAATLERAGWQRRFGDDDWKILAAPAARR